MIRGYPARPSVAPGERLVLHVATDAPRFRVEFHRWTDAFVPMHASDWLAGADAPEGAPEADWRWPAHAFEIARDWPSGVYVAHLIEEGADHVALAASMDRAAALFVVRGRGRSPLLYKLPFATYHAYNATGGGCFYFRPPRSTQPPGAKLSWRRPGGGIGGETYGAIDHYDATSPRQTFAHWDARFIRWLHAQGFGEALEFCADLDLHEDPSILDSHRLLLSVGHDEYWSEPMRDAVERFVARGGNAAFFGANLCWWRIHLVDGHRAMVCHQGGPQGALDHWWPASGAHRPEDALTGVSYRHGGGWWDGPREAAGFVVQRAEHWVFAGTGLGDGDRFGGASSPPLVGYECDGAPLEWIDRARGRVALVPGAEACGTPAGFAPLAVGLLGEGWQELPPREGQAAREGIHSATLGLYTRGGCVFSAGTTDWAQVLDQRGDAAVAAITRNVIERLGVGKGF